MYESDIYTDVNMSAAPEIEPDTKEQEAAQKIIRRRIIIRCILLIPLAVFCFIFIAGGILELSSIRIFDAKDTAYADFQSGEVYYFEEMMLIDLVFSSSELSSDPLTPDTYLVSFRDKNDELCYAYLKVDYMDDIKETCYEYMQDDTKMPGDVFLSGCYKCYEDELSDNVTEYYMTEVPGKSANVEFLYEEETASAYIEREEKQAVPRLIIGIIMLIGLIVSVFFIVKKANKMPLKDSPPVESPVILKKYSKNKKLAKILRILTGLFLVMLAVGLIFVMSSEDFAGIFVIGMLGSMVNGIILINYIKFEKTAKMTAGLFPSDEELQAELDRAYYKNGEFRCTPQLMVFPGGWIIPKNKIKWMYILVKRTYGIPVERSIIIKTVDCKEINIPLGVSSNEVLFKHMILMTGQTLPKDIIFGHSRESIDLYNEYRKQYKSNR